MDADQSLMEEEGEVAHDRPDGDHDYFIDEIEDCRLEKRMKDPLTEDKDMMQYKVKYTNSPNWNATPAWQPYTDMWGAEEAIATYHK
jgi:hypothetical protein